MVVLVLDNVGMVTRTRAYRKCAGLFTDENGTISDFRPYFRSRRDEMDVDIDMNSMVVETSKYL